MDSLEKECSAIGGLFQQILSDLKTGTPIWEDLISKATKLHTCLRATVHAIASYLDAFQKIADAATNTSGATKDIGTALTRICLRQKAVEARIKTFTSALMDCLVVPLQEKIEEWKKTILTLDKDHTKEFKKARSELKKRSTDLLRLQRKLGRKGVVARTGDLTRALQEVGERRAVVEEAEKKALRAALIEERSRYCVFVTYLKPVVDEEVAMLSELSHLQEVMTQLEKHTTEPFSLPPASEQMMADLKVSDAAGTWLLPSPSSSPGGSLGSRKSSLCSISSLTSSSSGSSPSPAHWGRPLHQNSGNGGSKTCEVPDGVSATAAAAPEPTAPDSSQAATWPNLQDTLQFERAASAILSERPHTISAAYERGQHNPRPALSVYTFQSPAAGQNVSQPASPNTSGSSIYARPPIPLRCSSLERPAVPVRTPGTPKPLDTPPPPPPTQTPTQADYLHPAYVNMYDLASMAATKAAEMKTAAGHVPNSGEHKTEPTEKDSSTSESSLESSSGYGSQTHNLDLENSIYNEVTASVLSLKQFVDAINIAPEEPRLYQRPASTFGYPNTHRPAGAGAGSLQRRSSTTTPRPPPPVRRTASISGGSRLPSREGSLENLPPPPAFLLSEGGGSLVEIQKSVANSIASEIAKRNQELHSGQYHRIMCSVANDGCSKMSRHTYNDPVQLQSIYRSTSHNDSQPIYSSASHTHEYRPNIESQPIYRSASNTHEYRPNNDSQPVYRSNTDSQPIYRSNNESQPVYRSTNNMEPIYMPTSHPDPQPIYRSTGSTTGETRPQDCKVVEHLPSVNVAETVRTLTELNHQPASPVAVRRSSGSRSNSGDRQTLMAQLSARLTPTLSRRRDSVPRASRVRQWISLRAAPDPKLCHDSLMEQIKRGTALRKTRAVNDRSAPRIR